MDVPEVQHRWEENWTSIQKKEFGQLPQRNRRRLMFWLGLSVVLMGLLLFEMAFSPNKIPLGAICLTGYTSPLPPNSGSAEDLMGLKALDNRSLTVTDLGEKCSTRDLAIREIKSFLKASLSSRPPTCILYISGHGLVDSNNEACLVLPGHSPEDTQNWLTIKKLLDEIESVQEQMKSTTDLLLVLDCLKEQQNWPLGVIQNQWQRQIEKFFDSRETSASIAVLCSTGHGQRSLHSPELAATAFGYFFKLGLAGLADRENSADPLVTVKNRNGGNGDGRVTVNELRDYLRNNVSGYVYFNRLDVQLPTLVTSGSNNFDLTWCLRPSAIRGMQATLDQPPTPSVSISEMGDLWRRLEGLKDFSPLQFAPAKWSELENRMMRLEKLAFAGKASSELAIAMKVDLENDIQQIEDSGTNSAVGISAKEVTAFALRSQRFETKKREQVAVSDLGSIHLNHFFGIYTENEKKTKTSQFRNESLRKSKSIDLNQSAIAKPLPIQELCLSSRFHEIGELGLWATDDAVKKIVDLQLRSERASLPEDIRIHSCLDSELNSAEQLRRRALDEVFIGEQESFNQSIKAANDGYDLVDVNRVDSAASKLLLNIKSRDEASAELVFLSQWCLRKSIPGATIEVAKRGEFLAEKRETLAKLASQLLLFSADAKNGVSSDFMKSWKQAQSELLDLSKKLLLKKAGLNQLDLAEIDDLLKTPLLPADTRIQLIEGKLALQHSLAMRFFAEGGSAASGALVKDLSGFPGYSKLEDNQLAEMELHGNAKSHPLLAIGGVSILVEGGGFKNFGELGEELRAKIEQFRSGEVSNLATDTDTKEGVLKGRKDLKSEVLADVATFRLFAPLFSGKPEADPVRRLRDLELTELLVWMSRRSLDDFYGFPGGKLQRDLHNSPAFKTLYDNLKLQTRLFGEFPDSMDAVVEERLVLSRNGLKMDADASISPDNRKTASLEIKLEPGPTSSSSGSVLSRGRMVLRLRDQTFVLPPTQRDFDFPLSVESKVNVPLLPLGVLEKTKQVEAFFRGNVFETPLMLDGFNAYTVQWNRNETQESKVTMQGGGRGRSSIVFVLDCSNSMASQVPAEGIGGDTSSRLVKAKGALATMLNELGQKGDTRVGVRFFGHRIGWSTKEPIVAVIQKSYSEVVPDGLVPENDVELVLPVGKFSELESQQILTKMKGLIPWGQSPLYLAIMESIRDFDSEDETLNRKIVVITDEMNYQFSPAANTALAATRVGLNDLVAEAEAKKIPISILGFGIAGDQRHAAEKEFQSIAKISGGEYRFVDDGNEKGLLEVLRQGVRSGRYHVLGEQNEIAAPRNSKGVPLGQEKVLKTPGQYSILFNSAEDAFRTEGGEALEFVWEDARERIVSRPYDVESPVPATMSSRDPKDTRKLTFRIHRSTESKADVSLPVSFQFASGEFTPRPHDYWIEVLPLASQPNNRQVTRYVFYDRTFEMGTPVPRVGLTLKGWPKEARRAKCSVFCKFEPTPPSHKIKLDVSKREYQSVPGISGLQFMAEITSDEKSKNVVVRITERNDPQSEGMFSAKIDVAGSNSVGPFKIVRGFDIEASVARHEFFFDAKEYDLIRAAGGAEILFTTRQALKENSFNLEQGPVEFGVGGGADVLPKDAADGNR